VLRLPTESGSKSRSQLTLDVRVNSSHPHHKTKQAWLWSESLILTHLSPLIPSHNLELHPNSEDVIQARGTIERVDDGSVSYPEHIYDHCRSSWNSLNWLTIYEIGNGEVDDPLIRSCMEGGAANNNADMDSVKNHSYYTCKQKVFYTYGKCSYTVAGTSWLLNSHFPDSH